MKLICKGYDTCCDRFDCVHAKPHNEYPNVCEYEDSQFLHDYDKCKCHNKYLRKFKLEKLNEYRR